MKRTATLALVLALFTPFWVWGQCTPASVQTDLKINNAKARLKNTGDLWWDGTTGRYYVPNEETTQTSAIFTGGLWMGGYDPAGNLHMAAQRYGGQVNSYDYFPGPINAAGSVDPIDCANWNKFFVANITDTDLHKSDWDGDGIIQGPIPESVLGWPAYGNPHFQEIHNFELPDQALAPFFDREDDGIYEPEEGDFPLIKGEQSIWWVSNDVGNFHGDSGGLPLGMEIQTNAFAYNGEQYYIDNTTFYEYKFIYRGTEPLDSVYIAIWADPDLGCYQDDYIACDVPSRMGFVYNGDALDEDCVGLVGYQTAIPVVAFKMIKSFADANGNEAPFASFTYFTNGLTGPDSDPTFPNEYYNFMTGTWKDGVPMSKGGNGYNPGQPAYPYAFDGSDLNGQPWTECTAGTTPADRRIVMGFGPMTLQPGEIREMAFAVLFKENVPHPCPDFTEIIAEADTVAQFFMDKCDEILIVNSVREAEIAAGVKVFPNPAGQEAIFQTTESGSLLESLFVTTLDGKVVFQADGLQTDRYAWQRDNLPDGLYAYRLVLANGKVASGKLSLK